MSIYSLNTKTKQLKGKLKCYTMFRISTLPVNYYLAFHIEAHSFIYNINISNK